MARTTSLPGFRDFYPAELANRAHITATWRDAARRHAFEEYDGPPLESLDLYVEKSGAEIVAQLYTFTDKGGREVALRPEMTPSLARMVGARAGALRKPIRWFSIPQLFRYERTQRGRLREHFQWNVDIIGEDDVSADAEVLATGLDALYALGLGAHDIVARFNDRRLLERLFLAAGVPREALLGAYAAVDKLTREPAERVFERLRTAGIPDDAARRVLHIFDVDGGLEGMRREFGNDAHIAAELSRLENYRSCLTELGHGDAIAFDPAIVRGLAYYTGIVFEIFDRRGELRAICGGGRYDDLLRSVSDVALPAVGFGMGDVVLAELLQERGLLPAYTQQIDYYIVVVNESERPLQRQLATRLRARGASVSYMLHETAVARQFKDAHARGARRTIVLGPTEVREGYAVVKDMDSGQEQRTALLELLDGVAADAGRDRA
jgi:histidyl-tRNA synthetase